MCKSKWNLFQDTLYYSVRVTYSLRVSRRRRDVDVVLFRVTAPRNEIIKNLGTRAWNFQMTMQTANSHIFQENVGNYWFISQIHQKRRIRTNQVLCTTIESIKSYETPMRFSVL